MEPGVPNPKLWWVLPQFILPNQRPTNSSKKNDVYQLDFDLWANIPIELGDDPMVVPPLADPVVNAAEISGNAPELQPMVSPGSSGLSVPELSLLNNNAGNVADRLSPLMSGSGSRSSADGESDLGGAEGDNIVGNNDHTEEGSPVLLPFHSPDWDVSLDASVISEYCVPGGGLSSTPRRGAVASQAVDSPPIRARTRAQTRALQAASPINSRPIYREQSSSDGSEQYYSDDESTVYRNYYIACDQNTRLELLIDETIGDNSIEDLNMTVTNPQQYLSVVYIPLEDYRDE